MRIEAFLLCYNETDIMRLVVKHYQSFCDKITIYDNHSTDGSAELAKSLGCEVIPFGDQFFNDQHNMDVKNSCWKGSLADWVIVADFDEVFFSGSMDYRERSVLQDLKDKAVTIVNTIGWQIMSDSMPKEDLLEVTNGYEFSNYGKSICFNPQAITEMNYNPGAHRIDPRGDVATDLMYSMYVLHYKHIGGVQRTIDRYKVYQKRMSKYNRSKGHGVHYSQNERKLRAEWAERMAKSKPLI